MPSTRRRPHLPVFTAAPLLSARAPASVLAVNFFRGVPPLSLLFRSLLIRSRRRSESGTRAGRGALAEERLREAIAGRERGREGAVDQRSSPAVDFKMEDNTEYMDLLFCKRFVERSEIYRKLHFSLSDERLLVLETAVNFFNSKEGIDLESLVPSKDPSVKEVKSEVIIFDAGRPANALASSAPGSLCRVPMRSSATTAILRGWMSNFTVSEIFRQQ